MTLPAPLRLHPTGVEALLQDVLRYGQRDLETGGLLLTAPGHRDTVVLALAGTAGIQRQTGLFVITMPALDSIFTYAEESGLQARAMVHSHKRTAFLSRTDRERGLRVRGFLSAVIPTYADPPRHPDRWGWWRHDSDWHPVEPAALNSTLPATRIVTFGADGVREH